MYAYALVAYLNNETEDEFNRLWKYLSENNITQYGAETKNKRPHITIADYENLDKERFVNLLSKFYLDKSKIEISLNILGAFIKSGTLYLAPTLSTELLYFHKNHHNYFKEFDENENSFYLPEGWIPHCTIASRLSDDDMMQAYKYCKNHSNINYAKLNEIALIEIEFNDDGMEVAAKDIFSKELT
jgi:2'-5' RNA ligase